MDYYLILKNIKDLLTQVDGINSLKLGLEEGISYAHVPFIRIVSGDIIADQNTPNKENFNFSIYLGTSIKNKYEDVYKEHFNFISKIKSTLNNKQMQGGFIEFIEAKADQDSLQNVKLSILDFTLKGLYCAN